MSEMQKTATDELTHTEDQARRAAKRLGLEARKSRQRTLSIDNGGGFQLVDAVNNRIIAGEKFDLTASDVVAYCVERGA